MLELQKISKSFEKPVFAEVDILAHYGDIIQISGPNGVGKTTLLKGLAGFISVESQAMRLDGQSLVPTDTAYVTTDERCFFPRLTVSENLRFFQKFYKSKIEIGPWVEKLQLHTYLDQEFQKCSTGYKKRLAILRGILKQVSVYLFDEPFANMDVEFKEKLEDLLFVELSSKENIILFSSNTYIENKRINQNIQLNPGL